jgi:hypothetical protein
LAGLGAVYGTVVDAENGVPLGFAQIQIRVLGVEAPFEARSNTSGQFRVCSLPSGNFTVSGQLADLGVFDGPLSLDPGQTLVLTLSLAPPAEGGDTGTIAGTVVEAGTNEPIEGATVLLPSAGQTAITNALGRFTFPSLLTGVVNLQVDRLGYAATTGQVEVEPGKATQMRVVLSTEPIAMDPITVTAVRRRVQLPDLEGFERRYNAGFGYFILEDEI